MVLLLAAAERAAELERTPLGQHDAEGPADFGQSRAAAFDIQIHVACKVRRFDTAFSRKPALAGLQLDVNREVAAGHQRLEAVDLALGFQRLAIDRAGQVEFQCLIQPTGGQLEQLDLGLAMLFGALVVKDELGILDADLMDLRQAAFGVFIRRRNRGRFRVCGERPVVLAVGGAFQIDLGAGQNDAPDLHIAKQQRQQADLHLEPLRRRHQRLLGPFGI